MCKYKSTITYHATIDLPLLGGYLFNHGTESRLKTRTNQHIIDCKNQGLVYNILEEKADRLFGTMVISKMFDSDFIARVVDRLNKITLKNYPLRAMLLKDWKQSLSIGKTTPIQQGTITAINQSNLSETECCFVPDIVSLNDLKAAIAFVETTWYYDKAYLRVSAKAYADKTTNEKKMAAKPIPPEFQCIINNKLNHKKFVERLNYKAAYIQSLSSAWSISQDAGYRNIATINVIITGDDIALNKALFKSMQKNARFNLLICNSDLEVLEVYKEMNNDRKTLTIINPPFNGNLHIKVLEQVLKDKTAHEIISINPARWLQDPLAECKKTSDYNKFKVSVVDHINDLEVIPAYEASEAFGIVVGTDLAIYSFNFSKNHFDQAKVISPTVSKLCAKLRGHTPTIDIDAKDGWRVRIPRILCGGKSGGKGSNNVWHGLGFLGPYYEGKKDGKPWYEFYTRNQFTKETETISLSVKFKSEVEAQNFCDSLNSIVGLFLTYHIHADQNVRAETIMWLDDYSTPWTNERLCNYFGITGYISDTEAVANSEWEEILTWFNMIAIRGKEK